MLRFASLAFATRALRWVSTFLVITAVSAWWLAVPSQVVFGQDAALVWPPSGWASDTLTPTFRWASPGYTHLLVMRSGATSPAVDIVLGPGINEHTPLTALTAGSAYRWRIRTNPLPPSTSPFSWSQWTPEWTFTTPARPASWASAAQSSLFGPSNGALVEQVNPTLSFRLPTDAEQVEVLVIPSYNPTAATSIVRPAASEVRLPPPPQWYGMLPGTTYYWRLRASNQKGALAGDHPSWGPWTDTWSFRTAMPSGGRVFPVTTDPVSSLTPTLAWGDSATTNFYYEVQLSRDRQFITDPFRATAMVYWEIRHGGMTTPPNSYTVPAGYPLTPGVTYFWRVRPRSGDNPAAVPWSATWSFVSPGSTGSGNAPAPTVR